MSVGYRGILWNPQKKRYDLVLVGGLLLGWAVWAAVSLTLRPGITAETLIIRGSAITAFLLLHVILCIGPLARIDRRFLPLLFNRRHLGVTMFLLALVHAAFSTFQFHALGGVNPLVSVLTAYAGDYAPTVGGRANLAHFPFEPLGALALVILFLMAATSHDFWLKNLGPSVWKSLHLLVLVAYGAVVAHVAFGALQSERSPLLAGLMGVGLTTVLGLHLWAALLEAPGDRAARVPEEEGFARACPVESVVEGRGKTVNVEGRRIAVYRHERKIYAVSNVCRHQGGPIGEGRILDGCITCPWHGWQYRPEDGISPPPFEEKLETFRVRVHDGAIWIDPRPAPPGTPQEGAALPSAAGESPSGGRA